MKSAQPRTYVAVGLWVNFRASRARLYETALARAHAGRNAKAIRELERVASRAVDDLGRWKTTLKWSAHRGDPRFALAVSYFERIDAPIRQLVMFEHTRHYPHVFNAERFQQEWLMRVGPLAR